MTGDSLAKLRQRLGLSQERLARLLDVSFATINRWENEATSGPQGPVLAFLRALETASLGDKNLGTRLQEWGVHGTNFLWARVFELAHQGNQAASMPRKRD